MKKVLIANRGEIALRIIRSIKEMGIKTVAIYSDADREMPFVMAADEAVNVGPAPSALSYLKMDVIIEKAIELGVDGIHPGYGFLSENAEFARKLKKNNIKLIGPSPESMEVMGDKLAAKEAVSGYDIPMVPGSKGAIDDKEEALRVATEVGYPLLIKASAGGGGKGMRLVEHAGELNEQMDRAISEAISAFGNGAVFIERFVTNPRHIEIQILADEHGNTVHLFERECSIQRRHQKVIEEAPSSVLTPEVREAMGKAAVKVAKACNYMGAGTVEFLVDDKLNFYFLEMNTRLQVEHPVTEMITGLDLVKEQVKVAMGETLSFTQNDLKINGHAIEVRVYAEDPMNNFLPDIGRLERYVIPKGIGVRVDDGYEEGMDIPIYYDPMIAKLVCHGKTREEAITRMLRAIKAYRIAGIETTLSFCAFAVGHPAFASGNFDTNFVKDYFKPEMLNVENKEEAEIASILAVVLREDAKEAAAGIATAVNSNWKQSRS